jgi:hypothetical protein
MTMNNKFHIGDLVMTRSFQKDGTAYNVRFGIVVKLGNSQSLLHILYDNMYTTIVWNLSVFLMQSINETC